MHRTRGIAINRSRCRCVVSRLCMECNRFISICEELVTHFIRLIKQDSNLYVIYKHLLSKNPDTFRTIQTFNNLRTFWTGFLLWALFAEAKSILYLLGTASCAQMWPLPTLYQSLLTYSDIVHFWRSILIGRILIGIPTFQI